MTSLPLPEWLLRWLSVDVDSLEGGSAHISFARFPEGELGLLAILAVLAGFAVVIWTYLREGHLALWKKLSLAAIRLVLLLVLALIIFYPVLEVDRARTLRGVTLLLVDESMSSAIEDGYRGAPEDARRTAEALGVDPAALPETSRAELIERLLERDSGSFVERLAEKNRVEVYSFADDLRRLSRDAAATDAVAGDSPAAPEPPAPSVAESARRLTPRGSSTDLAAALRNAAEQQGSTRIAGVVVISDGKITSGEGPAAIRQYLGEEKRTAVHAIGVGDPTPPKNLRVQSLLASERVFAGDPVAVDVRVQQLGYGEEPIVVELLEEFLGETGRPPVVIGSEEVRFDGEDIAAATGDGMPREGWARFQVDLEGIGRHRLTARIQPRDEETFSDDNERKTNVELIEEASRVLVIAGAPSFEYRFLQSLLRRDRRISVSAWLMSADADFPQEGDISLKSLPTEPEELFEYDVVVLVDPDPDDFPAGFPDLLVELVGKQNGGLVYVAGEKFSVPFFRSEAMRPLRNLLPLVPDLARSELESGAQHFSVREWPLVPTAIASTHSATRLSSRPERNRERWSELAGIHWALRIRKAKPGANVLFVHSDPARVTDQGPEPVLAWQFYEGGRTLFLTSDETYQWRSTTEEIYEQFWMQTVRYLTEARLTGGKRRVLQTDREAYDLGEAVRISALLQDERFRPLDEESVMLISTDPEALQTEVLLERDDSSPGWFRGVYVPRGLGEHTLRLDDGTSHALRVEPPDIEFQDPRLDEATLRSLASYTPRGGQRSAGSYSRLWEADAVPDRIPSVSQTVTTTDEPIPLWDNWFSLTLLALLLTAEWVLRKLCRLL